MWKCINPRPTVSCLYMINPSGYALGFIIYHIKHERVYVSYIWPDIKYTYHLIRTDDCHQDETNYL